MFNATTFHLIRAVRSLLIVPITHGGEEWGGGGGQALHDVLVTSHRCSFWIIPYFVSLLLILSLFQCPSIALNTEIQECQFLVSKILWNSSLT